MIIRTSNIDSVEPFISKLHIPFKDSHKGQNGRVLVIGGSQLFHSASIWAAEIVSYFVDIVHYSSTEENKEIFLSLKKKFRNGIVVSRNDLPSYIAEDDVILAGPGMLRSDKYQISNIKYQNWEQINKIIKESDYTYYLTKYLIENFPKKRFVFDAGVLQMMDKEWLKMLETPAVLTPHQGEFKMLFGVELSGLPLNEKEKVVSNLAGKYRCIILLKSVVDIISDGSATVVVEGGNPGLTKGGMGDILAGLTTAFYAKNEPFQSAVLASFFLKRTADVLFKHKGYWYNVNDIIERLPYILKAAVFDKR